VTGAYGSPDTRPFPGAWREGKRRIKKGSKQEGNLRVEKAGKKNRHKKKAPKPSLSSVSESTMGLGEGATH